MDINKLYEELGRADSAASNSKDRWEQLNDRHRAVRQKMEKEHTEERKTAREKHNILVQRLQTMREAVAMAENGMDPLLAKLKATGEKTTDDHEIWDDDSECDDECLDADEDDETINVTL